METHQDSRNPIGGKTLYNNQVYRVYFDDGDHNEYGVHADNPERAWKVRNDFSGYRGRCVSRIDYDLGLTFPNTNRAIAHTTMIEWLNDNS